MPSQGHKFWDESDEKVTQFFTEFPIKNQTDSEIVECDLDLLFLTIHYFSIYKNRIEFINNYVKQAEYNTSVEKEYRDKVSIPYHFFKGYFHPWGDECLSGIRVGNPKNPMYKYSYEIPSTRNYTISDAFNRGAIPCPKCFEKELLEIFETDQNEYE